jgi:hypothetical protein
MLIVQEVRVRILATASLAILFAIASGCGSSSSTQQSNGALSGNWQLNLVQNYPHPKTNLSVSGFVTQSQESLAGSFQVPALSVGHSVDCGGTAQITGSVSGTDVSFSVNPGGTTFSFNGALSGDNKTMSGTYQALAGTCYGSDTTGTWTASLIPALNGNFTGTLSNSLYMATLTGVNPATPIEISGSLSQSSNAGASNATITGTITAVGYPCFTNAYVSGTITGQNVYLGVFNYNGLQIGTLGIPGLPGVPGTPAIAASGLEGTTLMGTGQAGLALGSTGASPCPSLQVNGISVTGDTTDVAITLQ